MFVNGKVNVDKFIENSPYKVYENLNDLIQNLTKIGSLGIYAQTLYFRKSENTVVPLIDAASLETILTNIEFSNTVIENISNELIENNEFVQNIVNNTNIINELIQNVISNNSQYYISGEFIPVARVVYLSEDGKIYQFSNTNLTLADKVIGITNNMGIVDSEVEVISRGICNQFYGLEVGKKYYTGENGTVTNQPPTIGIQQLVGIAKSSTELNIEIQKSLIKV